MADEKAESQDKVAKKGGGLKVVLVVAGLMIAEAVGVFAVVSFSGFGTGSAQAKAMEGLEQNDRDKLVEIELVDNKFPNNTTGQIWLWDTQIYLQVRKKNKEAVETELDRRRAEITAGLRLIFSRIQDRHLKEPGSETITRQLTTYIDEVFGQDPDGVNRVDRVLLTKLAGFPADF